MTSPAKVLWVELLTEYDVGINRLDQSNIDNQSEQ